MAEEERKTNILFFVLIGVAGFAGGLFFLAILVIILATLGLLTV